MPFGTFLVDAVPIGTHTPLNGTSPEGITMDTLTDETVARHMRENMLVFADGLERLASTMNPIDKAFALSAVAGIRRTATDLPDDEFVSYHETLINARARALAEVSE